MKRYHINARPGRIEFFDILNEMEDGYTVRLTKISDGNESTVESFLNRHLFTICLKTGYISEETYQQQLAV